MVYIKFKIKWKKIFSQFASVGVLFFAFKRIVILTYVIWGCCKWFMPLLGYSEDTSLYYLFNEIQKIKYGNILLIVICVVMIIIFSVSFIWLIIQNSGRKLLSIEHSSLQSMSFSYDKEELEEYEVKKIKVNQCDTISNESLPLETKATLLITEICNILPEINNYIEKHYQVGYAGIPVGNIPSAFMLGYELDDANKKLYFHKNRSDSLDDNFHILKNLHNSINLHVDKKENKESENGDLMVIIQLTQLISDTDLVGVLGNNDYILKYEVPGQINYDIIESAEQANRYAQQIVDDIAGIQKKSNISKIKICIAASSDFVFALGTKFSKTQNINIVIYQFDKGRYSWGINVTKQTAVINNTCC